MAKAGVAAQRFAITFAPALLRRAVEHTLAPELADWVDEGMFEGA